ncbi:hypothetical protein FOZ60_003277 [Perkinsus olseni]|uniref:Uncharacterized protein n=1 Tax=Perkinsus olseni TaxID=32597 RepID=A0A7J6NVU1_PEROL|nr:hypothetical protein FOZ60_003277 [Perkinsus olseni]
MPVNIPPPRPVDNDTSILWVREDCGSAIDGSNGSPAKGHARKGSACCLSTLQGLELDMKALPGEVTAAGRSSSKSMRVTPLRWAPNRECLFVVMQDAKHQLTRVCAADVSLHCDQWTTLLEFGDEAVPFSQCHFYPFMFSPVTDQKGGVFFIQNPTTAWQFVREVDVLQEPEFFDASCEVEILYHHSKAPGQQQQVCTFFIVHTNDHGTSVRVIADPQRPTVEISKPKALKSLEGPDSSAPPTGAALRLCGPSPFCEHLAAHLPLADGKWTEVSRTKVSSSANALVPIYLPYYQEPLLLVQNSSEGTVDLVRPHCVESAGPDTEGLSLVDITADSPLQWLPQTGGQVISNRPSYDRHPLPCERMEEIMVVDTIREIGEVNHTRMRADGLLIGVDPDLVVGIEKSTIIIIAVERGVMMDTAVPLVIGPAAAIGSSPAVGPVKAEDRLSVVVVGRVDATIAPQRR